MLAILLELLGVAAFHDGVRHNSLFGSPLELITQLQHENENLLPAHLQPQEAWVRRRLDSLTRVTTNPIRFRVDTNSMKQALMATDSFLSYSTCFSVGQKFRRGLPAAQPTPPVPFVDTWASGGYFQLTPHGTEQLGKTAKAAHTPTRAHTESRITHGRTSNLTTLHPFKPPTMLSLPLLSSPFSTRHSPAVT